MGAIEQGKRRYERMIAESGLADTTPGQIALREMLGDPREGRGLIWACEQAREEARTGLIDGGLGLKPEWWWMIRFLSAEKLALITARCILTDINKADGPGNPMAGIAISVGAAVKLEMEYEAWQQRSKEDKKAGRTRDSKGNPIDVARIMRVKTGEVTAKTFRRWKRKLSSIENMEWTREMKLQIGTKLVLLAVEHGAGWFEYRKVAYRGKTERRIFLSELASQAIADINARLEVQRPYLLPMICPPKPWKRVENMEVRQ